MKDLNPILNNTLEVLYSSKTDGNITNALTELNISILQAIRELGYINVPREVIIVLEQIRTSIICIQEKSLDVYKEKGEEVLSTYFKYQDRFQG